MTISATTQGLRPGVCTSTSRPSAPFDGQVIYETDTNTLAVYDGSGWVSLNPVDRDRNVVINGAMQITQRGTSVTGITTGPTYHTADRYDTVVVTQGTWTQTVENDGPTGSGLRKSLKMLCTTADASPAAGDYVVIRQSIEGQNMQKFKKGTSSAERMTLSFWVKSNVTGTFIAELWDVDNTRTVSAAYTVSASGTWEKKTLTFPADTTGQFDNDNGQSFLLVFALGAGSTYTSGALQTNWGTTTNANRYVGQTNVAAATNNYWQITGVQLEAGAVATPFEFEDYGTTLAKCQRYYWRVSTSDSSYAVVAHGANQSAGEFNATVMHPVPMRATPTTVEYSGTRVVQTATGGLTAIDTLTSVTITSGNGGPLFSLLSAQKAASFTTGEPGWFSVGGTGSYFAITAEL